MSIRFAARTGSLAPRLGAAAARRALREPANDNSARLAGAGAFGAAQDAHLLRAALRHFAEHGLAAAQNARAQAETAFFAGDRQAYQWWLAVCRHLDRQLAREVEVHGSRRR